MGQDIKDRILRAALIELEHAGADFRMDDLAHRMRISKRTLYENFSSKEEIVDKVVAAMQEDLYEQHQQLLNDKRFSADEKIVAFFATRVRRTKSFPDDTGVALLKKMPKVAERVKARSFRDWQLLETFVGEAQHSNTFTKFDKKLFLYMLAGAGREIFENFEQMDFHSYAEAMEACIQILLYGIKKNGGQSQNDDQA